MSIVLASSIREALRAERPEPPRLLVATTSGAVVPVLSDPIAIQKFVEEDCGAEGWTIHRGHLIAVRFRDGVAFPHKAYAIAS